MPLNALLVGRESEVVHANIDARWLMSYAAGVGEADPAYFDTLRPNGLVAHPLFPVCVEWVTRHASSTPEPTGLSTAERIRGVHYGHDLVLHTPLRPGDVAVRSRVVAVARHRAGAIMTKRIDASYGEEPAWTTWMTSLFRDVEVDGDDVTTDDAPLPPPVPQGEASATVTVPLSATAAHVYTECARIWNPIHTDAAVADAAGLPGIILHGTASMAIGVSRALGLAGGVSPDRVTRICGRFGAMVALPSELTVRLLARNDDTLHFDVRTVDDAPAVRQGVIMLTAADGMMP